MYRLPAASLRPLSLAIALAVLSPLSHAAEQYRLESGPLSTQLNRFAAQAGIFLVSDGSLTEGQQSRVLDGSYSVEQALAILLEGSGLEAVKTGEKRYEVRPRVSSAGLELSAVSISGKAPGSITEGTGSYTTGSTSSSTRLNLTPQETPQSVTVITRQRMEDQKLDDLADALRATTGISVQSLTVGADSPQILSRGSSINNFQIDGIPTSSSMANYLQDMSIYDRVEVVRGATGIMSGLGKPSATINMIRKRPTYDPQATLTAETGNWRRYGSGLDVSGPLNENISIRGRFVADYKNQGAWTSNYKQEKISFYGITEFDITEKTLLTLGLSHISRNTNSPLSAFPMVDAQRNKLPTKPNSNKTPSWSYYDHDLDSAFASIEHQINSDWSLKTEINHSRYNYDSLNASIIGSIDPVTGAGSRLQSPHWASTTEQSSLDSYTKGSFSLFGRQHELMAGIALTHINSKTPNYVMTPSFYAIPNYSTWTDDTPQPEFQHSGKSKYDEYQNSIYLSSRLHITDSTKLLLGSRLTDWKKNIESITFSNPIKVNSKNKESGIFTPYLGLVQELNENWSIYASYTSIFQPQDAFLDQFIKNAPPEEGTSYEAGVKASFNQGKLNSSLAVFKTNQDNLAVWKSALINYELLSNTTTEGIELEFNGAITENWNLSSGYVYSVTKNDENERLITQAPRHSIKTFTTYRLPGEFNRLTIGGGFTWESKTGDDLKLIHQDSYALFTLMGRYKIDENTTISANIDNLFNKEYSYPGLRGTYGAPRNLMTSIKYTF